ncbi:MAG TPA: histone deacetylase family protein, partial [Aquabacterium sp.]|nr:histone deacetylase family protein [Aquabacterium sp.]
MLIFHNTAHARHSGRHEMFRGRLVPCSEVPARADFVEAELRRRALGTWRDAGAADRALL